MEQIIFNPRPDISIINAGEKIQNELENGLLKPKNASWLSRNGLVKQFEELNKIVYIQYDPKLKTGMAFNEQGQYCRFKNNGDGTISEVSNSKIEKLNINDHKLLIELCLGVENQELKDDFNSVLYTEDYGKVLPNELNDLNIKIIDNNINNLKKDTTVKFAKHSSKKNITKK